jgi:8-oxo-dGTP pyrophosphatase MutT (NUDIX family)
MDGSNDTLARVLTRYQPQTPTEADDLRRIVALTRSGQPWSRATPLHVTGSALIVHPASRRVLLRWHERQQGWIQVGGHADPGETDPHAVARREAIEETGLDDLVSLPTYGPRLLHLVVVPVPATDHEPAHEHADLRYVFVTRRPDDIVPESDDAPLRWLTLHEAHELTSDDNVRETLARLERLGFGQRAADDVQADRR